MALWDCSVCCSSQGSSLPFPPPHKGCSRPAVPRGHRAVTRSKEMSSEQDPLSPPSPFFPLWSFCLSFHLIPHSSICFFVSIPKLGWESRARGGWERMRML